MLFKKELDNRIEEIQRAITHSSQANREKELKADGTISPERHAD